VSKSFIAETFFLVTPGGVGAGFPVRIRAFFIVKSNHAVQNKGSENFDQPFVAAGGTDLINVAPATCHRGPRHNRL